MIESVNRVKVYEREGDDRDALLEVASHWNRSDFVMVRLEVDDQMLSAVVRASDLIAAVRNATNVGER